MTVRKVIVSYYRLQKNKNIELTEHCRAMLKERNIKEEWLWRTIDNPDKTEIGEDMNTHYFKTISENAGRILHIVINHHITPKKVITVFFDRGARR